MFPTVFTTYWKTLDEHIRYQEVLKILLLLMGLNCARNLKLKKYWSECSLNCTSLSPIIITTNVITIGLPCFIVYMNLGFA